ncbi:MAG: monooxygenase [Planctomycetales bacterium 71-10]|nr:MAG: monooxygenase [Planctomycetales bacterium 71-10]
MRFSLMFFSGDAAGDAPYRLMLEAARAADRLGFCAVWTPERHFTRFGGLFPNPAVTAAALAMITERVQLRAGSLVAPLHDVVRIAEDWAVVDQLSGGRVAISFGSGWNANDFVLFPDRYDRRHVVMYEQIEQLRRLWQDGAVTRINGTGRTIEIRTLPRPVQPQLPLWITSSGNIDTFRSAGRLGAYVLTHMIQQDRAGLAEKIDAYRRAWAVAGHDPDAGVVSLMLHTYLTTDAGRARETVRPWMREYLRSAVDLELQAAAAGGVISGGLEAPAQEIDPAVLEELLDVTFDRYFETASLLGTVETASAFVEQVARLGIDEIACLVDFGVERPLVLESLEHVATLIRLWS